MGAFSGSIGSIWVEIGARITDLERGLSNASKEIDSAISSAQSKFQGFARLGQTMSGLGTSLTVGITAPLIAMAGAASKFSIDFNAAMANVATLIPNSIGRIQELKKEVQDMATATGKSTNDLAEGLYQVISAFGDTADTAAILNINARAATAGLATTTDAINLTSAVTKAYGDTSAEAVEKVSDLAFVAVKLGQTTFPELAASIGKVTPTAETMGVSMEELFGVMATFTGVTGGAAEVATQLNATLVSLLKPNDDMTAALKALGFESGQAAIQQLGLKGTLDVLKNSVGGSDVAFGNLFTQVEALRLVYPATGAQADTFSDKLRAMQNVTGATNEAFKEQTEGVNENGFALKQLQQEAIVVAQTFGESLAPALRTLIGAARPVLEWIASAVQGFSELPSGVQTTVIGIAALAAALGPALIIAGQFISAIVAISAAGPIASAAIAGLSGVISAAAISIAAYTAGIAAAVIAIGLIIKGIYDYRQAKNEEIEATDRAAAALTRLENHLRANGGAVDELKKKYEGGKISFTEYQQELGKVAKVIGDTKKEKKSLKETTSDLEEEQKKLTAKLRLGAVALGKVGKEAEKTEDKMKPLIKRNEVLDAISQKLEAQHKKLASEIADVKLKYGDLESATPALIATTEDLNQQIQSMSSDTEGLNAILGQFERQINDTFTKAGSYAGQLEAAYSTLNVNSTASLNRTADAAREAYEKIKASGEATPRDIEAAWAAMETSRLAAMKQAGIDIPIETQKTLDAVKAKLDGHRSEQKSAWGQFGTEVSTVITNLAQGMASSLWEGGGSFKEKGLNALKQIGEAFTAKVFEPIVSKATELMTGVIADLIGGKGFGGIVDSIKGIGSAIAGVFGGAANTAGTVAGTAGGAAGSVGGAAGSAGAVAGAGVTGVVGAIGSVVSAVTGIVGVFQNMGMAKDLGEQGRTLIKSEIHLENILHETVRYLPRLQELRDSFVNDYMPAFAAMMGSTESIESSVKPIELMHDRMREVSANTFANLESVTYSMRKLERIELYSATLAESSMQSLNLLREIRDAVRDTRNKIEISFANAPSGIDAKLQGVFA